MDRRRRRGNGKSHRKRNMRIEEGREVNKQEQNKGKGGSGGNLVASGLFRNQVHLAIQKCSGFKLIERLTNRNPRGKVQPKTVGARVLVWGLVVADRRNLDAGLKGEICLITEAERSPTLRLRGL